MDWAERVEALLSSLCTLFYVGSANHTAVVEKCVEIGLNHAMEVYGYNISEGIWRPGKEKAKKDYLDPLEMLNRILDGTPQEFSVRRKLFLLEHFDLVMEHGDPLLLTKLRLLIERSHHRYSVILMGRPYSDLPDILADIPKILVPDLTGEDLRRLVQVCQSDLAEDETEALMEALAGLTALECENVLSLCLAEKKRLESAIIQKEKVSLVRERARGLIELCEPEGNLAHVGGLDALKDWLFKRSLFFRKGSRGIPREIPSPKGVLLAGPPGCGKSFLVSALAGSFNVNLIKLALPRLFSSLVGETEKNLSAALDTVRSLAPAILWIDEFEKFFPYALNSHSDGGVLARVLGLFLDFLQSRREGIFVCATTNTLHALPQEIMRAGRFDAVFFVDLPNRGEREAILKVIFEKYGLEKNTAVDELLIDATENFSGAEIEQAVIEALYEYLGSDTGISDFTLLRTIKRMLPLAVTMEEHITALRTWYASRARCASYPENSSQEERRRQCHISPK